MARLSVNARRFGPYKNYEFQVKCNGCNVAGVSKVPALKRSTQIAERCEDGDLSTWRKSPGRDKYEVVTLKRGVTHDSGFWKWGNKSKTARIYSLHNLERRKGHRSIG